jgi:PIN domain nuclease of toxin-antitoxin system
MTEYVVDTHQLFWYLTDDPKLSTAVESVLDDANDALSIVHVSVVVLAELYYLNKKLRYPIDFVDTFHELNASSGFVLTALEPLELLDLDTDSAVAEMHDRLIVGLARRLGATLLTVDSNILGSKVVRTLS